MATLTEVRIALKQGDRQKAAQVLKVVLKERPSADAWVLAAKMSSNPDTTKQHLQRALSFDSKHATAREMLSDLGGEQKGFHSTLAEEIQIGMEEFGQNSRLLSRLSPKQRVILVAGLFVTVLFATVGLLINLVRPAEVPTFIPAPTAVALVSDSVLTHFGTSGLSIADIQKVDPIAETSVSEQMEMTIQDAAGTHPVTVYFYADIDGLASDRPRLVELSVSNRIVVHQTAVLIYPLNVENTVGSTLESVFNAVTVPVSPLPAG